MLHRKLKLFPLLLLLLLLAAAVTGCSDINGKLYGKSEVLKEVKKSVPTERYEYLSVDHFAEKRPREDLYHFRSKERDLSFDALSTLSPFGIDGSTLGYSKTVRIRYFDAIKDLYLARADQLFASLPSNGNHYYCYSSFDELDNIARLLVEADDIYKEELTYNTSEWLKEHPLCNYSFRYKYTDADGVEQSRVIFSRDIDGTLDYSTVYDRITYEHVKFLMTNEVEDPTTPGTQLSRYHTGRLNKIIIQGTNVSEEAYQRALKLKLNNNSRSDAGNDMYSCCYYYPWDTYVMPLDLGLTDENYAPRMMEEYTGALGYPCEIKFKRGIVTWETDDGKWKMVSKHRRYVTSWKLTKDGEQVDIPFITCEDEMSTVHASYVVGISVDDFCRLFNLSYELDEENGSIQFHKK